jgi:hypothetical protein
MTLLQAPGRAARLTAAQSAALALALLTVLLLTHAVVAHAGVGDGQPGEPVLAMFLIRLGRIGGYLGGAGLAAVVVGLGVFRPRRPDQPALRRGVWAGWGLLALSSVVTTVGHLFAPTGSPSALRAQAFGQILLVLILAALVPLLRTDGAEQEATGGLRRAVVLELALATVAVLLTGVLPAQAHPETHPRVPAVAAGHQMGAMSMGEDYYGISRTAKLVLQTDLTPARTGENTMLFTVLSKDGRPQPVQAWTASLTRQSPAPAQALAIQVIPMVQGIARAAPTIPSAGTWVVDVRASTSDQQTISLRWTVTVTP